MRTEKNINNPWGLKGEELRKYRDAVEASEQSYASYSEAPNGVLYITPNTNELLKLSQALNKLTLEFTRVKDRYVYGD